MSKYFRPFVKTAKPSQSWRKRIFDTVLPFAVAAGILSCSPAVLLEPIALRRYESRFSTLRERGTAINNYLMSFEATLKSGSSDSIAQMAPDAVRSLTACEEQPVSWANVPRVHIYPWEPPTGDARGNPWKNLAAHWSTGSQISRSSLTLLGLNMINKTNCEPEIRVIVEGKDSEGRFRQDALYARLRVDFSGALPVIRDVIEFSAHSLLPTVDLLFADEAVDRGLDFQRPEVALRSDLKFAVFTAVGGGMAVGDIDGDNWEDVFLVGSKPNTSRLFRNVEGYFLDITAHAGVADPEDNAMAAAMGDVDGDRDLDLVVTHAFAPPILYRNRGNATFAMERFPPLPGSKEEGATTPTFADVDNDGDLDLYIAYHAPASDHVPETLFIGLNGVQDRLYINDGTGHFREEAQIRGLKESRWSLQGVFADFDEDGDVDLYQVNDFGRNTLYLNDGTGHFEDGTLEWPGIEAFGFGMSGSWGDYDADGDLDLYVSGVASGIAWFVEEPDVRRFFLLNAKRSQYLSPGQVERIKQDLMPFTDGNLTDFPMAFKGNHLLRREPNRFVDVGPQTGTNYALWSWGAGFIDFQNDGLADIYSTNGFITGQKADDL